MSSTAEPFARGKELRKMMKRENYCNVDEVLRFDLAFIDGSPSFMKKRDLAGMIVFYTETEKSCFLVTKSERGCTVS